MGETVDWTDNHKRLPEIFYRLDNGERVYLINIPDGDTTTEPDATESGQEQPAEPEQYPIWNEETGQRWIGHF